MDHLIGDCGHAYDHTFKYPDCTGKFHYSDATCEYDCLHCGMPIGKGMSVNVCRGCKCFWHRSCKMAIGE